MKAKFNVLGEPQGKARPRIVRRKNGDSQSYTPDQTVVYENLIRTEYRRQCGTVKFPDNAMLDMRIMAYCNMPARASKKKQRQMEDGEIRPLKTPDCDNIAKCVADALNQLAYRDDKQIVDCQIRKFYSHSPRIVVNLTTVGRSEHEK